MWFLRRRDPRDVVTLSRAPCPCLSCGRSVRLHANRKIPGQDLMQIRDRGCVLSRLSESNRRPIHYE